MRDKERIMCAVCCNLVFRSMKGKSNFKKPSNSSSYQAFNRPPLVLINV